jgi:siroheme synthase-like protein
MRYAYPIMLDVSDRQIVIIGGGAVAARKASGVIGGGAKHVRVVAPDFCKSMPLSVQRISERYLPQHLNDADLVFAATDDAAVNDQIVRDARARKILVCRADNDDEEPGDFLTPALFRDGPVTVTVSAQSPALSVLIRDELARSWQSGWSKMAIAMQTLRPELRDRGISIEQRKVIFRKLASPQAIELLELQGMAALRKWLAERHPEISSNARS